MSAEELPSLPDIENVTPLVTRILGQNPGPYTLQGTNTYLLQSREQSSAILIDAGQDFDGYLPLLKKAFLDKGYKRISDIIITHYHHDHVLGLTSILKWLEEDKLGMPTVHKFPCSENNKEHDEVMLDILKQYSAYSQEPFKPLLDGQVFQLGANATLRVISTPGHTEDSASFLLEGTDTPLIFTADTVLGRGTAVFVDLKALITSLHRMIEEAKKMSIDGNGVKLFCGHGPLIEDGIAKMKEYIDHRMDRERQVLDALRKELRAQSAEELVRTIYGPQLPEKLIFAAQNGIILHLKKLEQEDKVRRLVSEDPDDDTTALWELAPPTSKV